LLIKYTNNNNDDALLRCVTFPNGDDFATHAKNTEQHVIVLSYIVMTNDIVLFISPIGSINLREKQQQKLKKRGKKLS